MARRDGERVAGSDAAPELAEEIRDVVRARILRATRQVLAKRGLATTVDEVASESGVSRRTVFRHFPAREQLFAAAIRDGLRSYGRHLPRAQRGTDTAEWLTEIVIAAHRLNAKNGRIYWELHALGPELDGELAAVAEERREGRDRFVARVCGNAWKQAGGKGSPPGWLHDAFAVHLSAFATQALAGDFGRTPEEAGRSSAKVLLASLDAALRERPVRAGADGRGAGPRRGRPESP